MHIVQTCRALVQEEQKTAVAQPAFIFIDSISLGGAGIDSMRNTTGMSLALLGTNCPPALAAGTAGAGGQWCDDCPHGKDGGMACFTDPSYKGPPPINVFLDKDRWKGLMDKKLANSIKADTTGTYVTTSSRSENYSASTNRSIARVFAHAELFVIAPH